MQVTLPLQRIEKAVLSRFPVVQTLRFSDDPNRPAANLPLSVGLIAAIAESSPKPCCVLLPEVAGAPIAVSALLAVNRLRLELPELLRAHASVTFRQGIDNVLVHPAGLVYRYDGFFTPDFFKLGILDKRDSRSLPVRDIARLEKTTLYRICGPQTGCLLRASLHLSRRRQTGAYRRAATQETHRFDIHIQFVKGPSQGVAVHA